LQFSPMKLVRNSCKSPGSASALLTKHVGKIYQRFLGVLLKKNTQKISYKLLDFFASFFYQEKNEEYEYILFLFFYIAQKSNNPDARSGLA